MRVRNAIAIAVLTFASAGAAELPGYESPAALVQALNEAYRRGDIEAAMGMRDFREEARLQLNHWEGSDEEQVAVLLESQHVKMLKNLVLPRFKKLECEMALGDTIESGMVELRALCEGGAQMPSEKLFARRTSAGWRIVALRSSEEP